MLYRTKWGLFADFEYEEYAYTQTVLQNISHFFHDCYTGVLNTNKPNPHGTLIDEDNLIRHAFSRTILLLKLQTIAQLHQVLDLRRKHKRRSQKKYSEKNNKKCQ